MGNSRKNLPHTSFDDRVTNPALLREFRKHVCYLVQDGEKDKRKKERSTNWLMTYAGMSKPWWSMAARGQWDKIKVTQHHLIIVRGLYRNMRAKQDMSRAALASKLSIYEAVTILMDRVDDLVKVK